MRDTADSLDLRHLIGRRLWQGSFEVWPAIGHHERHATRLDGLHAQVRENQGQVVAVRLDGRFVEGEPEFTRPSPGFARVRYQLHPGVEHLPLDALHVTVQVATLIVVDKPLIE